MRSYLINPIPKGMKKIIAFFILLIFLSGCTKDEATTTTTTLTATISTISTTIRPVATTSTGFPRLKPLLGETTMGSDGTFNGTFMNTADYPIRLLEISGQCGFFEYNRSTLEIDGKFRIIGRDCKVIGGVGERYATVMDLTYLVFTDGPVNRYTDHGTLRGSIIQTKNG